jgi:hypothetical protein|tara:strand:+ start:876 stop:1124 length:249 start_codon:yes stop_codon:yes gene_type:complete
VNNFYYTHDDATTERISAQRDDIYEGVVAQFRVLMAKDMIDEALALADEFFEWMDPEQLEDEPTVFYNEHELQERFYELTDG